MPALVINAFQAWFVGVALGAIAIVIINVVVAGVLSVPFNAMAPDRVRDETSASKYA